MWVAKRTQEEDNGIAQQARECRCACVLQSGWAHADLPPYVPGKSNEFSAEQERTRRAHLLARDTSKRVVISIFADGPTRVLRFADPQTTAASVGRSVYDMCKRYARRCRPGTCA